MNTAIKIIVGTVIGIGLVILVSGALLVGAVRGMFDTYTGPKSSSVTAAAAKIAEFDLPAGYVPEYSVSVLGFTVAGYNPGDGHSHLTLIQGPKSLLDDADGLAAALRNADPGSYDRTTRMSIVDSRAATVRGEETTLSISEGTSSDGTPYREITAVFQGKGGPALLVIEEPTARWDDARIEAFINSIR